MIKITTSLEVLLITNNQGFNQNLVEQFWINLGECSSLRVLDLSHSGDISAHAKSLGNAVAFNARKKGVLEYINLEGCLSKTKTVYEMYKGMCIS